MIYGMDYLGGAKYPDVVLKNHPKGWAAGFFGIEFGDVLPLVTKLADSGKCPLIRIQLLWSHSNHTYGKSDLPRAIRLAKRFDRLTGHARIELSPFCEHNLALPDPYLEAVKAAAPSCEIINTPWKGAWSKRFKNETHDFNSAGLCHNFSFDGVDCLKYPLPKPLPYEALFLWTPRFNGKVDENEKTPIGMRRAWPDGKLITQLRKRLEG